MELRNYQLDLINNTRLAIREGRKRILCVLPCGAGKTICFAYMAARHKGYVWFLVHRQELVDQAIDTFDTFNIPRDNIYIGMVGTALKKAPHEPTMIIFDEAHHCTAKTWQNIINTYPNIYIIGLTATPLRLDGSPLGNIFTKLVVGADSNWLIEHKYLCEYDYYAPNINIMTPKIKGSDYDVADIQYESRIYGDVKKYLTGNKIIIYCPNIAFSQALASEVGGVHFDGNTPKTERKQIIHDFRVGKIKILCNVDLIGEGFDVPDCDSVILLRPTMSLALYIQQSMRCLRPAPNKRATIYDLVGNCYRHGLPTDSRSWSLTQKHICRHSDDQEVVSRMCSNCYRVYSGSNPICPYCKHDNGKTRKQLEIEKKAELERIEKIEKRKRRQQVGMSKDYDSLVALARKRGYKSPEWWARMILKSRSKANAKI